MWAQQFTTEEREAVQNLEGLVNTVEWSVNAVVALVAIFLFVLAAHRSKQGDYTGAVLSAIGASVCAIAPIIAKHFFIGG